MVFEENHRVKQPMLLLKKKDLIVSHVSLILISSTGVKKNDITIKSNFIF